MRSPDIARIEADGPADRAVADSGRAPPRRRDDDTPAARRCRFRPRAAAARRDDAAGTAAELVPMPTAAAQPCAELATRPATVAAGHRPVLTCFFPDRMVRADRFEVRNHALVERMAG